ncbi:MAG TPA: hypothetical protein VGN12_30470, partial [Pirellulales bacterium]
YFQNGGVILFKQTSILEAASVKLQSYGYKICVTDCDLCKDEKSVMKGIVDSLGIVSGGPNIGPDSFNDFMRQIEFDGCTGVVVVLRGFDRFRTSFPACAFHILDIVADHHRSHMLMGDRLTTLVQSDDPYIDESVGQVGGYKPSWNDKEWSNNDRVP